MRRGLIKISPTVRVSCELLGVSENATPADLKKAYHKVALIYHPDRQPDRPAEFDAATEFRKVTEAYELLCDPLRVAELNRKYMTERLHANVVEGFNVTFGSFFGYRIFQPEFSRAPKDSFLLGGQVVSSPQRPQNQKRLRWEPIEENNSILDHSAFDAIEVVYAGRFSKDDESAVKGEVDGQKLVHLPWVILNNQGLLKFLGGDLRRSGECYRKLCERVPNNIIFMYRYGLCLILDAFQKPRRTLLGTLKPDRIKIEKGLALLEHCLKIGEGRTVGRQKCLVIRKVIADVRERMGQGRRAKKIWREILKEAPGSIEATFRIQGFEEAERLLARRHKNEAAIEAQRLLLKSPKPR